MTKSLRQQEDELEEGVVRMGERLRCSLAENKALHEQNLELRAECHLWRELFYAVLEKVRQK